MIRGRALGRSSGYFSSGCFGISVALVCQTGRHEHDDRGWPVEPRVPGPRRAARPAADLARHRLPPLRLHTTGGLRVGRVAYLGRLSCVGCFGRFGPEAVVGRGAGEFVAVVASARERLRPRGLVSGPPTRHRATGDGPTVRRRGIDGLGPIPLLPFRAALTDVRPPLVLAGALPTGETGALGVLGRAEPDLRFQALVERRGLGVEDHRGRARLDAELRGRRGTVRPG